MLPLVVIFNNYFHDLATGVLFGSGAVLWTVARLVPAQTPETAEDLRRIYRIAARFALVALVWIVLGGIPRAVFFTRFEWDPAVVRGLTTALVVKHVLMLGAVGVGATLVWRTKRRLEASPR